VTGLTFFYYLFKLAVWCANPSLSFFLLLDRDVRGHAVLLIPSSLRPPHSIRQKGPFDHTPAPPPLVDLVLSRGVEPNQTFGAGRAFHRSVFLLSFLRIATLFPVFVTQPRFRSSGPVTAGHLDSRYRKSFFRLCHAFRSLSQYLF